MMSDKVDWTKNLGDAVLAQQPDVMDAIQRLRSMAYDNKKLVTTKQQKVSVQTQENRQAIVIEPADPNTMYVPYYDPAAVYGAWPYAEYPPYYFGYPSYIGAGVIAAGLAFGTAWAIGRWGNYWGGGFNWGNRNLSSTTTTGRPTSGITGSTIPRIVRAFDTTTSTFSSASATTTSRPAPQTGWISAAVTGSRCCVPDRIGRVAEIASGIALAIGQGTAAVIVSGIVAAIGRARQTVPKVVAIAPKPAAEIVPKLPIAAAVAAGQ